MSNSVDLNMVISHLVSNEVTKALGPHLEVLTRLSRMIGVSTPSAQNLTKAAPAKAQANGKKRVGRPPKAGRRPMVDSKLASKFCEGQRVKYKQGKGTFEARVVGINAAAGTVILERSADKKEVERLADKVFAA